MWDKRDIWHYCQDCGESDARVRPHYARGLCRRCYLRLPFQRELMRKRNSKESYKEMKKKSHKKWREANKLYYAKYQLKFWTKKVEQLSAS